MLDIDELPRLWSAWRSRWADRNVRMDRIDRVVAGDLSIFDPDEESIDSKSPNLVQVALEDTAEAASLLPSVRVDPVTASQDNRRSADKMEQIAQAYLEASKVDLLVPRTNMDLVGFGFACWVVWPDMEQRIPLIEKRDPRTCYPEPGFRMGDTVRRCIFARELYVTQLPEEYQQKLRDAMAQNLLTDAPMDANIKVTVVEFFSHDEYVLAGIYSSKGVTNYAISGTEVKLPVEFDRIPNRTGVCPVVIGQRNTFDGEPRGQLDQVLDPFEAHVRLMGMILDYADQAVYSDIWVKDLVGTMPWGGGGYIELGPQGAIGRVPPAVSSLDVQRDLQQLMDAIHLGGRWPKSRPGEIDQAIASAKFVEATTGVMNTAIRQYHLIVKYMMEQSLRLCFEVDRLYFPGTKTAAGTLRNQQYLLEYDSKVINPKHRVRADYGLGLGRDPAQSAVLHIQYQGADLISRDFVQENIDGLSDVARERARIDTQKFREMALAKLLMGLEQGTIPEKALVEIARARENGQELFDLFEKYIVAPKEEAAAAAMQSGLPGAGPMAAGPVGPDGMPVPIGPDGMPMPPGVGPDGAPLGPPVPTPPPPEILSRLNLPAGPGATLGAQVQGALGGI